MKPHLVRSQPRKGRLWTAEWKRTAENAPYGADYELLSKGRQADTNQLKALQPVNVCSVGVRLSCEASVPPLRIAARARSENAAGETPALLYRPAARVDETTNSNGRKK